MTFTKLPAGAPNRAGGQFGAITRSKQRPSFGLPGFRAVAAPPEVAPKSSTVIDPDGYHSRTELHDANGDLLERNHYAGGALTDPAPSDDGSYAGHQSPATFRIDPSHQVVLEFRTHGALRRRVTMNHDDSDPNFGTTTVQNFEPAGDRGREADVASPGSTERFNAAGVHDDHLDGSPATVYRRDDRTVSSQTWATNGRWTRTLDFSADGSVATEYNNRDLEDIESGHRLVDGPGPGEHPSSPSYDDNDVHPQSYAQMLASIEAAGGDAAEFQYLPTPPEPPVVRAA